MPWFIVDGSVQLSSQRNGNIFHQFDTLFANAGCSNVQEM